MPLPDEIAEFVKELLGKTKADLLQWNEPSVGRFVTEIDDTKIKIAKWQNSYDVGSDEPQTESIMTFQLFDAKDHELISRDVREVDEGFGQLDSLYDSALFSARHLRQRLNNLRARLKEFVKGLVIRKALYEVAGGPSVDATKKVAGSVVNGKLAIKASDENFGDPAVGAIKQLRVEFTIDGKPDVKVVKQNETLTIG